MTNGTVCGNAARGKDRTECVECKCFCQNSCVNLNKKDTMYFIIKKQACRCQLCVQAKRLSISSDGDKDKPDGQEGISHVVGRG